jgi:uncharacterized protein DUF6090
MAKLFNSIRKKLVSDKPSTKRTTNYLKYAIGEIVLVVIGILIALALNNWNENRKVRNKERVILTEMKQNLEEDLKDALWNINANKELLFANETILNVLENNLPFNDSLKFYYGNILGNTQLIENTSAYDNLMSIGFDLVNNDSLRIKITHLYSNSYEYITNLEQRLDDKFQFEKIHPQVLEKFTTEVHWHEGPRENAYPIDQTALAQDHTFVEILKFNIYVRKIMISQYEMLASEISDLILNIEKEIE